MESKPKPSFSIIIAINDQIAEVRSNLPLLLSQQYDDYEVIVVDESKTEESDEVLKLFKAEYKHLYNTFLPKYQFQKNRRRLAFTIGVKAAKKEWIVFTDITTPPPSDQWLAELAAFTLETSVLFLGYINKKSGEVKLRDFGEIAQCSRLVTKTERERTSPKKRISLLWHKSSYDFIAVRADMAHELLKLFALDPRLLLNKEHKL